MCGIAGMMTSGGQPPAADILNKLTSSLTHRGPDGQGRHIFEDTAILQTRLAIIDLETGNQPLGNEDGSVQVIFNGEIYNFVELRNRLKRLGHQFQTQSDTETIVH